MQKKGTVTYKKEIWKDVEGYEGYYQVSNMGRVKSLERTIRKINGHLVTIPEKILKPRPRQGKGYFDVALYKNSTREVFQIHRLVAITFIPNPQNKPQVNHKNGIKHDNKACNLEWNTPKENIKHAYNNGLCKIRRGEKNSNSKLTKEDVLNIREIYKKEEITQKELAEMFNTTQSRVSYIVNRRHWKHI